MTKDSRVMNVGNPSPRSYPFTFRISRTQNVRQSYGRTCWRHLGVAKLGSRKAALKAVDGRKGRGR